MAFDILIVDDEPDIRMLVEAVLRDEGYETRQAGSSDAAIAAFRERLPALVILDVWLQGSKLDGIQILETIKREQPDLPVVMISGHGTIETAVAARSLSAEKELRLAAEKVYGASAAPSIEVAQAILGISPAILFLFGGLWCPPSQMMPGAAWVVWIDPIVSRLSGPLLIIYYFTMRGLTRRGVT